MIVSVIWEQIHQLIIDISVILKAILHRQNVVLCAQIVAIQTLKLLMLLRERVVILATHRLVQW